MKILVTLFSLSGLLSVGYWGHISYDQKRLQKINQLIPDLQKGNTIIKDENLVEKQSRTYAM
jgi:preprotein translocase subunit YajC